MINIHDLFRQGRSLFYRAAEVMTETTAEITAKETYPTAYPEAHTKWQNGQKTVNVISNIAPLAAVVLIANEILVLVIKGFRASTLPNLYFCAEVIVLSPEIKKVFNSCRAIPFYFSDKELKNEDQNKKALAAQEDSKKALGDAFKKSLAYRVYTYIDSHLNQ